MFNGAAYYVGILLIPQRYQAVNGASASRAGVLLLCATLVAPLFAFMGGAISGRFPAKTWIAGLIMTVAAVLILVAVATLSSLPVTKSISNEGFGFQVLLGAGLGMFSPVSYMVLMNTATNMELAPGTGALNMARSFGGTIGVAVTTAVHNNYLSKHLKDIVPPEVAESLKHSLLGLGNLNSDEVTQIREVFGHAYNEEFRVTTAFSAAGVVTCLSLAIVLYWRRNDPPANETIATAQALEAEKKAAKAAKVAEQVVEQTTSEPKSNSVSDEKQPEEISTATPASTKGDGEILATK